MLIGCCAWNAIRWLADKLCFKSKVHIYIYIYVSNLLHKLMCRAVQSGSGRAVVQERSSESNSTGVWCVPGFGAGFEIALKPSKLQKEGERPGKGHFYFLRQTLVCTKPWFKRDLRSGGFCTHDQHKSSQMHLLTKRPTRSTQTIRKRLFCV